MMLEAKGIAKTYVNGGRELRVLDGVSLSLAKGEIVAIVGPSGAGKSTLLNILGGLDEPTEGEVVFEGGRLSALADEERARVRNARFGFIFQFYHLLREFTALENVMIPFLMRGEAGTKEDAAGKARALLETVGLTPRASHRPSELSGGEQQRVAVARALMNDPDILFCDEPTGNLDHKNGLGILEILLGLNRLRQTAILLVTHSRELAQGAHRILHILDGRLEETC